MDRRASRRFSIAAVLACAASLCSVPALAQQEHARGHGQGNGQRDGQGRGQGNGQRHAPDHRHGAGYGGYAHGPGAQRWHGDIARFHQNDGGRWRGGHWSHGHHGGRLGWWWVVGPSWYFYPAPIYPYPNPWEPAEVIVLPPPISAPPMPPAEYWYYCDAARTYYPYVTSCPSGWQPVPARPGD